MLLFQVILIFSLITAAILTPSSSSLLDCDSKQHVTGPAHVKGQTLDLIASRGLDVTVTNVLDVAVSDH